MPSGYLENGKAAWEHILLVVQNNPGVESGDIKKILRDSDLHYATRTVENALTRLRHDKKIRTERRGWGHGEKRNWAI